MPKTMKFTAEFEIDEVWVADGFKPDDEWAQDIIENALPFAHSHEVAGRILKIKTKPEPTNAA